MGDFLRFEMMITPMVVQVLFWFAVAVTIIGGVVGILGTGDARFVLLIIFGPLAARVYAEILIVFFRINDHLRQIMQNTEHP